MKFLSVHGPRTKIYWHLVLVTLQLAYGIFRYKLYHVNHIITVLFSINIYLEWKPRSRSTHGSASYAARRLQ